MAVTPVSMAPGWMSCWTRVGLPEGCWWVSRVTGPPAGLGESSAPMRPMALVSRIPGWVGVRRAAEHPRHERSAGTLAFALEVRSPAVSAVWRGMESGEVANWTVDPEWERQ